MNLKEGMSVSQIREEIGQPHQVRALFSLLTFFGAFIE
jgi:outer membrane protein assembly factor BamE (lipoprotein component of BamABCDE complex)